MAVTPDQLSPEPVIPTPTGEAIYFGLRGRVDGGYEDLGVFRYDKGLSSLADVAPQGWNLQDVSPDSSRLLLNHGSDLYLANYDGGGTKLIAGNFFDSGSQGAVWKIDGSGVVYILTGENGNTIVSDDLSGGEPSILTMSGDSPIEVDAISPGGDIYWQKGICSGEGVCQREGVYRLKPDGGDSEKLEGIKRVRLSPDGSRIAYTYENESGKSSLGTVGTDLAQRTGIPLPGDLLGDFAWSPDGSRIAAVRYDRSDYSGKVSGTRNFQVDAQNGKPVEYPESQGILGNVRYSPQGDRILLTSSLQSGNGYTVSFQSLDPVSGIVTSLPGFSVLEAPNFLLLTNVFWAGN